MEPVEIREILERFCPKPIDSPPGSGGIIRVADFLAHLASNWPFDPSDDEWTGLNALCRKLSVVKVIRQEYPRDWGRGTSAEPLTPSIQMSLIAILVAYGSRHVHVNHQHGMEVKLINAAFMALDGVDAVSDDADTALLASAARRVLDDVLSEQRA